MNAALWPYDELKIKAVTSTSFDLETPWYSRRFSVNSETTELRNLLLKNAPDGQNAATLDPVTETKTWTEYFSEFHGAPLFYFIPRRQEAFHDQPPVATAGLSAFRIRVSRHLDSFLPTVPEEMAQLIQRREWDLDACLNFSRIPGTDLYDPLSVFSVFRRFYFLDVMDYDQTSSLYDYIKSTSSQSLAFAEATALIGKQTLEVTSRCREILTPALKNAGAAEAVLTDFIQAEEGHDKIARSALRKIAEQSGNREPAVSTLELSLELFKDSGVDCFLAFAFAISMFEQGSYDGKDPFAELMRFGGLTEAAALTQCHFDINENGKHDAVAIDLIKEMPPVPKIYVEVAIEVAELLSKAFNQFSAQILYQIQNKR